MKIHFELTSESAAPDRLVPANGHRMFVGHPAIPIRPKSIRVVSRGGSRELVKATALLVVDVAEGMFRSHPLKGETIEGVRTIDVAETFKVKVENHSSEPLPAHPVITAVPDVNGSLLEEEYFLCLSPCPEQAKSRRLPIRAHQTANFSLRLPCTCRVRRITTRSDAALDVSFVGLSLANVSLIQEPLPVEFFHGGVEMHTPTLSAAVMMKVALRSDSDQDHHVEIDVDIENVHETT